MKFLITSTSGRQRFSFGEEEGTSVVAEINTLEELMDFISHAGQVIVDPDRYGDVDGAIEVYDDYRE